MARIPPWEQDMTNRQFFTDVEWAGRAVKVAVSPTTGTVQVHVKAGDAPFTPSQFGSFLRWLEGWTMAQGILWDRQKVVANSVEMNLDYRSLWVEAGQRVKLQTFVNGWVQAYQRANDRLRAEIRLNDHDGELTLQELGEWVENMAAALHDAKRRELEREEGETREEREVPPPDPDAMEVA